MTDDGWLNCPSCGLKHRARPDGVCPKCQAPVYGTVVGTPDLPPPNAPPTSGRPETYADYQKSAVASAREGFGFAIVTGLIGAAVGGGIWAAVVLLTGYEVGWVAWGVGLVAGLGVRFGLGEAEGALLLGGACAVFGFLFGKLLIAAMFTAGDTSELAKDDEYVTLAVMARMVADGDLPAELAPHLRMENDEAITPELSAKFEEALHAAQIRSYEMTADQRYEIVAWYSESLLDNLSFGTRLFFTMSLWDFLWFFLAVGTGARVAAGRDD